MERATARLVALARSGEVPLGLAGPEAGELVAAAKRQGLAGLLDEALGGDASWPGNARESLREAHREDLARTLRLLALGRRAQQALAAAGLRSLALKGAAVTDTALVPAGLRPMGDVDLLVLDDWQAARAVLERHGFVALHRADHAWSFRDADGGGLVELHWSPTSCPGFHPVPVEAAWEASVPGPWLRAPGPEDLFCLLGLHAAFQHALRLTLAQWLDFRRLLESRAARPETLAAAAGRWRAGAALSLSLDVARAVVAAPVEPALLARLEPRPSRFVRSLAAAAARDPARALVAGDPAPREIAALRFALARGRRRELLARTLRPALPGLPRVSAWRRAGALLRRWGGAALRP
ncbi:MAG: nucleotidyltransferase family protein [Vicinamibacteria bacterium]